MFKTCFSHLLRQYKLLKLSTTVTTHSFSKVLSCFMSTKESPQNNDNSNNDEISHFFFYGTLRDDINPNSMLLKDCIAFYGKVFGYKLYQSKYINYPFAMKSNNTNDFVIGRLVTFNFDNDLITMKNKLKKADRIEGYNGNNLSSLNLYERQIVNVKIINDPQNSNQNNNNYFEYLNNNNYKLGDLIKAHMYYQINKENDIKKGYCYQIQNGDWKNRHNQQSSQQTNNCCCIV